MNGRLLCLLLPVIVSPLAAQPLVPIDTSGLADGRYASMEMLYERSFLRVDVMRLSLRFGRETADRLETFLVSRNDGGSGTDAQDTVADIALEAQDAIVHGVFLRSVSLPQFLKGLLSNLERARDAGVVSDEEFRAIEADVRVQYLPLEVRGLRPGDGMWYRIRGDSLHVVTQGANGEVLIEERAVGSERRRAVLGGYLAPGSDFRKGLTRSLLDGPADSSTET